MEAINRYSLTTTDQSVPSVRRLLTMENEHPGPGSEPLLTADDVAELLRVTTPWVYAQTRAGAIPHVGLGRYKRYRRSAIEDWLSGIESFSPSLASGAAAGMSGATRVAPPTRGLTRHGARR